MISAVILPVATNVISDIVPDAARPYLWLSVPVTVVLTVLLILLNRRPARSAPQEETAASWIQHNVTYGGRSFAVQNGTLQITPRDHDPADDV